MQFSAYNSTCLESHSDEFPKLNHLRLWYYMYSSKSKVKDINPIDLGAREVSQDPISISRCFFLCLQKKAKNIHEKYLLSLYSVLGAVSEDIKMKRHHPDSPEARV